jgi:2-iminoacetate synthase
VSVPLPDWLSPLPWLDAARNATRVQVEHALGTQEPDTREFAALISPGAGDRLESLAQRALELTRRHFGRAISLYAPLYLSNYCPAGCTYCGFASDRKIARHKLSAGELDSELSALKGLGLEEILLLAGDRLGTAGFPFVRESVKIAAARFPTVTVEVFPMSETEYHELAVAGCTGVTMYQETYDPVQYEHAHRWGEKRDYPHRLDAPSRALAGGIRVVGLGALLGLGDPLYDALSLFRHAVYLRRRFWRGGVAISFPRLRPEPGGYDAEFPVSERLLAQLIFAFRICLPDVPLVLSTRESPRFRDGMAGVGISRMSVASRTTVGGYDQRTGASGVQFEVNDHRDVESFCAALESKGLQPVFKNWDAAYREEPAPVAAA